MIKLNIPLSLVVFLILMSTFSDISGECLHGISSFLLLLYILWFYLKSFSYGQHRIVALLSVLLSLPFDCNI